MPTTREATVYARTATISALEAMLPTDCLEIARKNFTGAEYDAEIREVAAEEIERNRLAAFRKGGTKGEAAYLATFAAFRPILDWPVDGLAQHPAYVAGVTRASCPMRARP